MNWINKCKLPAIKAIKHNSQPCLEINDLWYALYLFSNMAQHGHIDKDILNEIAMFLTSTWDLFLEEFTSAITTYNVLSTSGSNKLAWRHLKHVLKDKLCLKSIINIANTCLDISYWPSYFKTSTTIIILKPNKASYDMPKSFGPIVLLNTLGKLIEKVIGDRLQFHAISNNFIH